MANIYVRSTDGLDTDNGTTWALAKAKLSGASAIEAAGDTIYISQAHNETSATPQTITLAGTSANPVRLICGNDAAEPPDNVAASGVVTTTGASNISLSGALYAHGLKFNAGSSTYIASITLNSLGNESQYYESCEFNLTNMSASSVIYLCLSNNANAAQTTAENCTFKFGRADLQKISSGSSINELNDCIFTSSTTFTGTVFSMFGSSGESSQNTIVNGDFSTMGGTFKIASPPNNTGASSTLTLNNCKLPSGWTGGLLDATPTYPGFRAQMYNCDSGATNYRVWIETYAGTIRDETTIVKTGGATDGTTPISWKMTTRSVANALVNSLDSDSIAIWNTSTGSSKTLTIDIIHDSVTALTDDEVWVDVIYLSSATTPLGSSLSDKNTTVLTAATYQTTSTATWTTTGLTNLNKQKLEVTFTPQMAGLVQAKVHLARPSYTIYVDPKAVIS